MAIEAGIIDLLTKREENVFGEWDYISHQIIASPFKPIDYMDKMDIFGYKFISGYSTISRYLIIEIKKDKGTINAVEQLMKYVDWVNQEYSFGDYSMINAFLVAHNIPKEVIDFRNNHGKRNYIKDRRPAVPSEWNNIRLIEYSFDKINKKLKFNEVN
ncbi:endonuclease NucS domain-containing protein [Halobacillus sp. H74]|uniref:endonuclease NucS domain-containing protein n=1 Tax=Halobacillus sp. H74 TaxID=3457436 RepID=UPI003FCC5130